MHIAVRAVLTVLGIFLTVFIPWRYARYLARDIRRRLAHVHGEGRRPIGHPPQNIGEVLNDLNVERPPAGVAAVLLAQQQHQQQLLAARNEHQPQQQEGGVNHNSNNINNNELHGAVHAAIVANDEPGATVVDATVVVVDVAPAAAAGEGQPAAAIPLAAAAVEDVPPPPRAQHQPRAAVIPLPSIELAQLSLGHQRLLTCSSWTVFGSITLWPLYYAIIDVPSLWSNHDEAPRVFDAQLLNAPFIVTLDALFWVTPPVVAMIIVSRTLFEVYNLCADTSYDRHGRFMDEDLHYIATAAFIVFYFFDGLMLMFGTDLIKSEHMPYTAAGFIVLLVVMFVMMRRRAAWVKSRFINEENRLQQHLRTELLELATRAGCNDTIEAAGYAAELPDDERHGYAAQRGNCATDCLMCCCGGGKWCCIGRRRYRLDRPNRNQLCACMWYGSLGRLDVSRNRDRPLAVNAFASGCGNVTFTSGMVHAFSDEELRAMFAHELAHVKWAHPRRMGCALALLFTTIMGSFLFVPQLLASYIYECDPSPAAGGPWRCEWWTTEQLIMWHAVTATARWLPVVLGVLISGVFVGVRYKQRQYELQADRYAAELMGGTDALLSALALLHDGSRLPLAYTGWWQSIWFTHPSCADRFKALGVHLPQPQELVDVHDYGDDEPLLN